MAKLLSLPSAALFAAILGAILLLAAGCAGPKPMLLLDGLRGPLAPGVIWDTASDQAISFEQLVARVAQVRVLYVGERHSDAAHHQAQLQIVRALVEQGLSVRVGMEMFDRTYQAKLDRWIAGEYEWPTFLSQVHWYANWKHDDGLYRDILEFARTQGLRIIGLNIPFWLPPKIATGGLDSLSAQERFHLPADIDTGVAEHRAYVADIFKLHRIRGRENFDYFYEAQCAWEDGMAQAVAENSADGIMVVLAGNGHIRNKYGIPERAFGRTAAPYQTICLASRGDAVDRRTADFIWAVPAPGRAGHP